jgi:hypothetical protein
MHVSFSYSSFFLSKDKKALRHEKQRKIAEEEKLPPYLFVVVVVFQHNRTEKQKRDVKIKVIVIYKLCLIV